MKVEIPFSHRQSAHCESGVLANLLTHHGLELSEAMSFGLGAGLFFAYLPFIKINHLPLTTFRSTAGSIIKQATSVLGICVTTKRFRFASEEKGMEVLDRLLGNGVPVGLQTGIYWLPYIPRAFRFHFNAHNLVVYGRQGDDYLISDPVMPGPVTCSSMDLQRARFAKGTLAPRGRLYYITRMPEKAELVRAARKAIVKVAKLMIRTPVPIIGVRGIRFLANRLERWPMKLGDKKAAFYLGQLVRMQEEIGTGGGGFRFIYAAFLQECSALLAEESLTGLSGKMTAAGDRWREFAVIAARICKGRAEKDDTYAAMADIIRDCAERERRIFTQLLHLFS
ncbi:MAG: BtrH N-terminal domain-containing protein [Desulfobulbaceae bacterium]|nr:BtrH N-terminal domain-containing protein [Desulfobulbaceae bacterium]